MSEEKKQVIVGALSLDDLETLAQETRKLVQENRMLSEMLCAVIIKYCPAQTAVMTPTEQVIGCYDLKGDKQEGGTYTLVAVAQPNCAQHSEHAAKGS